MMKISKFVWENLRLLLGITFENIQSKFSTYFHSALLVFDCLICINEAILASYPFQETNKWITH